MFDETRKTFVTSNQRLSVVTIFLASMAFVLVFTSIAAFIYVTRKEKILRKIHFISIFIITFVEIIIFVFVIICCIKQSKNNLAQILTAILILISLFSLMALIYFLLEDIIKEKIVPYPNVGTPYKSYEIQDVKTISRRESPSPTLTGTMDVSILTPPIITTFTQIRIPSDTRNRSPNEIFTTSPIANPIDCSSATQNRQPLLKESSNVVDYEKVRQDLLAAIEERTISALEKSIQQVKNYNYVQQLKFEYERALELLNRLMKIEHMKIRVLRLNQATIAELHSYAKPPDEVSTVMRATFLLLGHSDKELQDWTQIQNLLGRLGKESVRRRCYELNPLAIHVEKAREAKDILKNFDLIRVSEISIGLAAFFSWAVTMIEEREKLLESQRKILR